LKQQLLIDADIVAYKAAASCEHAINWEGDLWTYHGYVSEAVSYIEEYLSKVYEALGDGELKLFLTDAGNWRKAILPTYKENRTGTRKPVLLAPVRDWMREHMSAVSVAELEADDLLGIAATKSDQKSIIVSEDKDLKTVPCTLYNPSKKELVEVSAFEADYNHMTQTLTGDVTDGYTGCPSVGPKRAATILKDCKSASEMWDAVVSAYSKQGLSEDVALQQARVARICRASDFDFHTGKVLLWTPPQTPQ
jgi:DNA polymerase-1